MRKLLALLIAVAALPAASAGFDCSRAAPPVERAICADARLSELDEHLGRYYAAARDALKDGANCLQQDQRAWLGRRNACKDGACLSQAYLDRLAELDALQPGVTAIRNIELPRRASLVWIVGPAADKVAAPANAKASPLEASGALLNEVATGDGFVLREASGARHLIVPAMLLEAATAERLDTLALQKSTSYRIRGHAAGPERLDFEPSRCRFVHRLP